MIDVGVTKGLLEKSGTWISYKNERLGQGRENARIFLKENTDIRGKIEHELRKQLGLLPNPAAAAAEGNGKPSPEAQKLAAAEAAKQPPKAAAAAQGRATR